MAALMLMSCWVFFAPEAKAVNSGSYNYEFKIVMTDGADGWDNGDLTLYGKPSNGKGTESQITKKSGLYVNQDSGTYSWGTGSSSSFPTRVTYYYKFGGGITWRSMAGTLQLFVNGTLVGEQSFSASSSAFKAASGTVTLTVASGNYPKANTVEMSQPEDVTIQKTGNATTSFTSLVKDQYGVIIGSSSTGYSKSVSLSSNRNSTTGISASYGNTTKDNDPCTITVTNTAKLTNYDTNEITATASYSFNGSTKTASKKFTVTDPQYTFSFNGNGGTISPTSTTKYYYNKLTSSEFPSDGERAGYEFIAMYGDEKDDSYAVTKPTAGEGDYAGQLTTSIPIEDDKTWYAAWWSRNYTVTFVDLQGNVIGTTTTAKYGKTLAESIALGVASLPDKNKVPAYERTPGQEGTYDYTYGGTPANWTVVDSSAESGTNALPAAGYGEDGSTAIIAGNTTFRVKYDIEQKAYTVSFNGFDGTELSKKEDYRFRDSIVRPVDQTMSADNYFTYKFLGWHKVRKDERKTGYIVNSKGYVAENATDDEATGGYVIVDEDSFVRENATYVPVFEKTYIDYTVNFEYYGETGNYITTDKKSYHYNDDLDCPTVPESYTSGGYRYYLTGWTKNGATVGSMPAKATENATYVATYGDGEAAVYKVEFKYFDTDATEKTVTQAVSHDSKITAPVPPATYRDENNEYTFTGWLDQYGLAFDQTAHKDVTYTAQYDASPLYTATFVNEGEVFGAVNKYTEGETINAPAGTPSKPADKTASEYRFTRWVDENGNSLGKMGNADATYYAEYEPEYIDYTVKFVYKDADGNDKADEKTYHYGAEITIPEDPAGYKDNTYSYAFKAWDKDVSKHCTENVTYTATYRKSYNYYKVTWYQEAGDVNGKMTYSVFSTDANIYNEKVRMPSVRPVSVKSPSSENYSLVLSHWEYVDESGNRQTLVRGYQITKDMEFYPVYKEVARVCTVKLYDEDGTTLLQKIEVPYGDALSDVQTYSEPTKAHGDDYHFEFAGWLNLADDTAFGGTVTDDCSLKASFTQAEHTFGEVVADKEPTFFETGLGTQTCTYCSAVKTGVEIPVIPDSVAPTAKLFIKNSKVTTGEAVSEKVLPVAPSNNLVIATDDKAEESKYNPNQKGSGTGKIDYYVSVGEAPVDFASITEWRNRFDYDAYVEALKAENGTGELTEEQKLMLKEFESNATAYVGDLENSYVLNDGDVFFFYARITDRLGNVSYIRSQPLSYDKTAPVLEVKGGGNGASKFCTTATATASDKRLTSFTVNGEAQEVTLNEETGLYTATVTITEAGEYQLVATDESGNITEKNITVIGAHREKVYTTPATCEEDGQVVKKCTLCGEQIGEATVLPASGHNWVLDEEVAATCVEDAYKVYRCTNCNKTKKEVEEGSSTGSHIWGEYVVTKEATCSAEGSKYRLCTVCGEAEDPTIIPIDENAHKFYRGVVTKPTCTEQGFTTRTCKYNSAHVVVDTYVEPLGHTAGDEWFTLKEATCTEEGERVHHCVRCDIQLDETKEKVAPLGHSYVAVVTEPTATEQGYTTYTCSRCGHSYKADYVDAKKVYSVTFFDEDGTTELKKVEGKLKGETVTTAVVEEPTKASDNTYKYFFSHWALKGDSENKAVQFPVKIEDANIELKAVYSSKYINYTIVLLGELDSTGAYPQINKVGYLHYGQTVTPNAPTKSEDKFNTYTFIGWVPKTDLSKTPSKEITVTVDNEEYVAVFKATAKTVNVVFGYDYTSDYLALVEVPVGTASSSVKYPDSAPTPVKAADDTYHYSFSGWSKMPETITESIFVKAQFSKEKHNRDGGQIGDPIKATCTTDGSATYKCTCGHVTTVITKAHGHQWGDVEVNGEFVCKICGDTKDSGTRYQVTFYDEDGATVIKNIGFLKWNDDISSLLPATPTKASDDKYNYTFSHWYKKGDATKAPVEIVTKITENAEYVAAFKAEVKKFTVIYAIDAEHVLQITKDVEAGAPVPAYTGATPTTDRFDDYQHYTFNTWLVNGVSAVPETVTGDLYITAFFLGESHEVEVVSMKAATCTEAAQETYKCKHCGYTYSKAIGKPLGHKWKLVEAVEPTFDSAGYEIYKCDRCDEEKRQEVDQKHYIKFTVIVINQDGNPVEGAKVSIFDGTKFISSGYTDAEGKIVFRVEEAKDYTVIVEGDDFETIKGTITVNPDGSVDQSGLPSVDVHKCSCTCHRDGIWPTIFRFFHKIIKMLVGDFVCCGNPDPRYNK